MLRLTEAVKQRVLQLVCENKESEAKQYLKSALGVKRKQAKRYFDHIVATSENPPPLSTKEEICISPKKASVKFINDDIGVAEVIDEDVKTVEELLAICKVDMNIWEIERQVINKWATARSGKTVNLTFSDGVANGEVSDSGGMVVQPLYQVKVFLKRRKVVADAEFAVKFFKEEINKISKELIQWNFKSIPELYGKGNCMLEVSVPDLHLGKLAWSDETRFDNYDSKEAVRLFKEAVKSLVSKAPASSLQSILLPIGNDFFNVDNHNGTTTAGTPQSEDSRWQKTFKLGCSLLTEVIDQLTLIAPVKVVIVQGNHDYERSFYLGEYLAAWFREHPAVTVDNKPTIRKYVSFGKNLIGFTHGSEEKLSELPITMATEVPQEWANSTFREIHLGHLHQESLKEIKGIKIRHLPSLCSTDAWHAKKGYIGNLKSAQGFLYSVDGGLEAIYYYNA
jgi:predicted phosphodiesterase